MRLTTGLGSARRAVSSSTGKLRAAHPVPSDATLLWSENGIVNPHVGGLKLVVGAMSLPPPPEGVVRLPSRERSDNEVEVRCRIASKKFQEVCAGLVLGIHVDPIGLETPLGVVDAPSPGPTRQNILLGRVTAVDGVRVRVDALTVENGTQLPSVHVPILQQDSRHDQ